MAFNTLGDLLHRNLRKKGLAYQVEASMVLQVFQNIAKEWWGDLSDSMRPMYVKDQVLVIAVLAPALAQELKLREKELIEAINKAVRAEAVIRLRFLA